MNIYLFRETSENCRGCRTGKNTSFFFSFYTDVAPEGCKIATASPMYLVLNFLDIKQLHY